MGFLSVAIGGALLHGPEAMGLLVRQLAVARRVVQRGVSSAAGHREVQVTHLEGSEEGE